MYLKDLLSLSALPSPGTKTTAYKPDVTTQSKGNAGGNFVRENQKDFRWIHCPICDSKTKTKVYADTVMFKFPIFCPKCKKETRVDVMQLKIAVSK